MEKFFIKSKIYKTAKTNKIVIIILSVCVIITSILGIISILTSGVKIGNVSPIIISLAIAFGIKKKSKGSSYYIFDMATVLVGQELRIEYIQDNLIIVFQMNDIVSIQYSDKLQCLRFVGDYAKTDNGKTTLKKASEYLLYVGSGEEIELIDALHRYTPVKVEFMDR